MAQVVKLCRKHRLYSALIYILTRGLDDFVAPAVELLLALADTAKTPALAGGAGADEQATAAHAAGFKLLVYLRCCLRQQGFPPGAGPLPLGKASIVKAGVLGALMFTVSNFKLQLARCPGAHSCARVQLHWHATQQLKQQFRLRHLRLCVCLQGCCCTRRRRRCCACGGAWAAGSPASRPSSWIRHCQVCPVPPQGHWEAAPA